MHFIALAEILTQSLMVAAVLLLVRSPDQLLYVPIIYLLAKSAGTLLLAAVYARNFGRPTFGLAPDIWRPLLKAGFPLALASLMAMLNFNFDTLMIGVILGKEDAGLYGAAYRLVWMPSVIATAYFTALYPSLDRSYKLGLAGAAGLLNNSFRLAGTLGFGIGVAGAILAVPGFRLIYGPEYQASILSFQLLIWTIPLLFISRHYRLLLVSFDHQQAELKLMSGAAVINVVLNLLFIPRFGLPGAAAATLASELFLFIAGYLFTRRLIGRIPLASPLLRLLLASAVLAAALLLTTSLPLLLQILSGGLAYLLTLLALRLLTLQEIRQWANTL
jgi:O-antigen/teichoic acid export membrane protein